MRQTARTLLTILAAATLAALAVAGTGAAANRQTCAIEQTGPAQFANTTFDDEAGTLSWMVRWPAMLDCPDGSPRDGQAVEMRQAAMVQLPPLGTDGPARGRTRTIVDFIDEDDLTFAGRLGGDVTYAGGVGTLMLRGRLNGPNGSKLRLMEELELDGGTGEVVSFVSSNGLITFAL